MHQAFRQLADCFDSKNGGFGSAPKFPAPHNLIFLMEYGAREKRPEALAMAEKTLVQMYRGGIFDHIGGGFSRYSTDGQWLVPHFEKMLYDNSLLVMAYIKPMEAPGGRCMGVWRKRFWNMSGGSLQIPREAFTAARTRTAMVWKENTMYLPGRR